MWKDIKLIFKSVLESLCEVLSETYTDIVYFFKLLKEYFTSKSVKLFSKVFVGYSIFLSFFGVSLFGLLDTWIFGIIGGTLGATIVLIIQAIYKRLKEKE